jgi:hypothetical protein
MSTSAIYTADEIRDLPTLCVGQCCSLKIDTGTMRVWLCRVGDGVSIERYRDGRWTVVEGGCEGQVEL